MAEFNMEGFMDSVCSKARNITKKVTVKATETVETAKISIAMSETNQKISECKEKIGDIVYKEYLKSKDFEGEIGEICKMIDNFQNDIEAMEDKQAEVKNEKRCTSCGAFNSLSNAFCAECGEKFNEKED